MVKSWGAEAAQRNRDRYRAELRARHPFTMRPARVWKVRLPLGVWLAILGIGALLMVVVNH